MKKYFIFPGVLIAAVAIFFSCKKEYTIVATGHISSGVAYLKIVHASPNFTKLFGVPDGINVFVGSTKVNGPVLKFNSAYPAIGSLTGYAEVQPGDQAIKISVGGVVTGDSIAVDTLHKTLTAGSYYTLLITDSLKSATDAGKVWMQDNLPSPSAGNISLRFVNMVLNSPDTVNLYSKRRGQVLFSGVMRDSVTAFANFPTLTNVLDSFYVQKQGVNQSTLLMTSLMFDQKVYTLYFIGDTANKAKTRVLTYVQNK